MGQLTIRLGQDSGHEWKIPKTPAEVIELARKYSEFEALRLPGSRLPAPSLEKIRDALVAAEAAHEAAVQGEQTRTNAMVIFHNTLEQAIPLLKTAIEELLWKYRHELGALEGWGLPVRYGASGKVLITKPKYEAAWANFLYAYTAKEASLPEADRVTNPPLATLQALAQTASANDVARVSAQSTREQGVADRLAGARPLLDLLQLACGMLVVTVYDGRITPVLQDWGFNIIQTPAKPDQATPPVEPPVEPGVPA